MTNKRFQRTEQAIFAAYYKIRDYPSAQKLSKRAGISRSTFYRHHQATSKIPQDYEEYLFAVYLHRIKKYLNSDAPNLKIIFFRFVVFISSNREVFKALFGEGRKEIIKKMLHPLKPVIIASWDTSVNLDRIFKIYENEVLGIIEVWSEERFINQKITVVFNVIMYMTEHACRNLLPLKKFTKNQEGQG